MDKWIKENKITTTIVIVLVIVFGIIYTQKQSIKTENQNSKTSLDISNINLQTKCASSAKSFFEYYIPDPQERQNDEYSNHFSIKLNKCFVLVTKPYLPYETVGGNLYGKYLYDAIEKKQYGIYEWATSKGQSLGNGMLMSCAMMPDGDENNFKVCVTKDFSRSQAEFDAFAGTYMEN